MIKNILFKKFSSWYLKLNKKIQSKEKRPFFSYLLSEILFFAIMKLAKNIKQQELSKLNKKEIRKFYDLYGNEETLMKYKLSQSVLDEIIS